MCNHEEPYQIQRLANVEEDLKWGSLGCVESLIALLIPMEVLPRRTLKKLLPTYRNKSRGV